MLLTLACACLFAPHLITETNEPTFVSGSFHLTPEHRTLNNQNSLRTTERGEANFLFSPHRQLWWRRQNESFFAIIKFLLWVVTSGWYFATQSRPLCKPYFFWWTDSKREICSFRWIKKPLKWNCDILWRCDLEFYLNRIYSRWIRYSILSEKLKIIFFFSFSDWGFLRKDFWKKKQLRLRKLS